MNGPAGGRATPREQSDPSPIRIPPKLTKTLLHCHSSNSTRRLPAARSKNSLPALKPLTKPSTPDESRLCILINQVLTGPRVPGLRALAAFLSKRKPDLSPDASAHFAKLLGVVLSSALPFSVVRRGYRHIFFVPCDLPDDVRICYDIFPFVPALPDSLLRSLVRRLGSASPDDRLHAKGCLLSLDSVHFNRMLKWATACLSPAPPHGVDCFLECITQWLGHIFYDSDLFAELEAAFHILHFAPHYQAFHGPFVAALKRLHDKDDEIAHRSRRFILMNWPRLEPQRAILFMQEATAICLHGPPVDEFVWQRLSWRACSIQWQLANEGIAFILQTIECVGQANHAVLRFLLEDEARTHWSPTVKEKAKEVLGKIPECAPAPPKVLALDTWNCVREMAKANWPVDFAPRRGRR
jgi:hypothetical protein